jgi:lysophospholipase L1-like esterase
MEGPPRVVDVQVNVGRVAVTGHVILFGDSVFDNAAYVAFGQRPVFAHLKAKLAPLGGTAELRAVDGATTKELATQLTVRPLPESAVLVLSIGGNDAILRAELLGDETPNKSLPEALMIFRDVRETFRLSYRACLEQLREPGFPVIVCTIYNPKFDDPVFNELAGTALSFFNDVIVEEALAHDLPIIDLRRVCAEAAAFANPIEPSEYGGGLIADAIVSALDGAPGD